MTIFVQNRLVESLNLFKSLSENPVFTTKTALILFMNKVDLFQAKLATKHLSSCFPHIGGEEDVIAITCCTCT